MFDFNFVDRVVEPILIYTMAIFYYWLQYADLAMVDMIVNIVLGIIIAGYTALKGYELFINIRHDKQNKAEEDASRKNKY